MTQVAQTLYEMFSLVHLLLSLSFLKKILYFQFANIFTECTFVYPMQTVMPDVLSYSIVTQRFTLLALRDVDCKANVRSFVFIYLFIFFTHLYFILLYKLFCIVLDYFMFCIIRSQS